MACTKTGYVKIRTGPTDNDYLVYGCLDKILRLAAHVNSKRPGSAFLMTGAAGKQFIKEIKTKTGGVKGWREWGSIYSIERAMIEEPRLYAGLRFPRVRSARPTPRRVTARRIR